VAASADNRIDDLECLKHNAKVDHLHDSGDRNLANCRERDQFQGGMVSLEMHSGKDAKKERASRAKLDGPPAVNMTVRDIKKHRGLQTPIYERAVVNRGGADFVLRVSRTSPSPSASVDLAHLRPVRGRMVVQPATHPPSPRPRENLLPPLGKGLEAASRAGAPANVAAGLAVEAVPGGGLRITRKQDRPRLSLCMIVRDSARTLPAALESIRPWVDEMVIVDTGSLDETPRIVESYGGRLFHFPWPDSFSVARNESLRHARGDWIFWMDSDDTIPPECGRKLRRLIDRDVPASVVGYVIQVHCPGGDEDGDPACDVTMVDHVKLFRNRPELRFDGRIHEQILPAIRASSGEVAWTDIYVVHSGSDQSKAAQEKKRERDLRLLHLELAERPEHPFTLFNLGMTHVHGSRFEEAVDYLRHGIARSGPEEAHLRKAFALLVYALMRLGRRDEALSESRRGREMFPRDVELRFREGVLLHELGRLDESRRAYLEVLSAREERHFASVDRALTGFKARQNLAVVAGDLGDFAEAERQWREVTLEAPKYRAGWRGLAETMIRCGRSAKADALAEGLLRDGTLRIEGLVIKGQTAVRSGRLADARDALDRAFAEQPDDVETLRGRCQFLFDHGEPHEAEAALRSLIARAPHDGAAHHNLGTLLMRTRRFAEAVRAYHEALRYRPNYAPTFLNLGYALKDCGRKDEARAAWQEVLRLAPNDPTARNELGALCHGADQH
jgi:tetratricopeptide (TPR) repeat protein